MSFISSKPYFQVTMRSLREIAPVSYDMCKLELRYLSFPVTLGFSCNTWIFTHPLHSHLQHRKSDKENFPVFQSRLLGNLWDSFLPTCVYEATSEKADADIGSWVKLARALM